MKMNYADIKSLATENGCGVNDLLALAANNDPFYCGKPAELEAAAWFRDQWRKFGYSSGIHLRRIHYQVVSQDPPLLMPNGLPYQNTERCWDFITMAGKWARYLEYVNPDSFVDRRNPEANINYYRPYSNEDPRYEITNTPDFHAYDMPFIPGLQALPDNLPGLPAFEAQGYDNIRQPYMIELWAEKSTMNDVLLPICRRFNCNLVTGLGEMSITAVRYFMKRVAEAERPARILYISDFDPAGLGMPISVARKIEFYARDNEADPLDIALQPVVLTVDQIQQYRLPKVPVKDSDLRKDKFESAYGAGQVELDSLEALHPGVLKQIITHAIESYFDPTLFSRAMEVKHDLQDFLNEEAGKTYTNFENEFVLLHEDYQDLLDEYNEARDEFNTLAETFAPRLAEIHSKLNTITDQADQTYTDFFEALKEKVIDLEDYDLPDPYVDGDPDNLLYHSNREYLQQLEAYKSRRNNQ